MSEKINKCIFDTNHPNHLRKKIRDIILNENSNIKTKKQKDEDRDKANKEKSTNETKTRENEEVRKDEKVLYGKDLRDPKKYPNLNKDKLCYFLTKGTCKYGAKGENHLGKCVKYHPDQCREYNLNGTMESGCKNGEKCEKWHPTYFCHLSINSKTCKRVDCYFKHHRNCTVTKSENFLDPKKESRRPHPALGHQYPMYNKWQQQHRPQHHYQQTHQQYHQIGSNYNQQHHTTQSPQIPYDQLKQVIQTVILEMNTY